MKKGNYIKRFVMYSTQLYVYTIKEDRKRNSQKFISLRDVILN